ncbi:MAG: 30S ribosomal protein S21 [bacterium]
MVEVRKRDNESTDSLLRRFSRKVQQSGVLLQARKVRFYERKKAKRKLREDAMRKVRFMEERERLIKLGELDEFAGPQQNRSRPTVRRTNMPRR